MLIGAGTAQLLPQGVQNAKVLPLSWPQKACIGALAALFPDMDYLLFPLDPLQFLAYWHRAHTHSVLLAPLWAWLLTLLWRQYKAFSRQALPVFWICLIAIFSHILSDSLTIYGTRWFSPLSDYQVSWNLLFVVDIYFSLTILLALILLIRWRDKTYRSCVCLIPLIYLGFVMILKSIAAHQLPSPEKHLANQAKFGILVPQPFSPLYWQAIKGADNGFHQAYLKLTKDKIAGKLSRLSGLNLDHASYQLPAQVRWRHYPLMPGNPNWHKDAEAVWQNEKFIPFRDFTDYPVFYGYQKQAEKTCVWFSDLRYHWPGIVPTFRFGMCQNAETRWQLYRMKYLSQEQKLN